MGQDLNIMKEMITNMFIEACKSCYTNPLYLKRIKAGESLPGICQKCNDRLEYLKTMAELSKVR